MHLEIWRTYTHLNAYWKSSGPGPMETQKWNLALAYHLI